MQGVETDHIFHKLFRAHPDWLRELTGLPLPPGCRGTSCVFKQLEIRCDLLLEPGDSSDPHYLIEFQLYHDHSIFNRSELARHLLWRQINPRDACRRRDYQPRAVETVVIFGSQTELPASSGLYPRTRVLFMDELLEILRARQPLSPLLAALAPLKEPLAELETTAAEHYDRIHRNAQLQEDDREILTEIFLNLLLQRFKNKSREEIRQMIAELTPLHETRAGRELYEDGMEQGMQQGMQQGKADLIRRMAAKGKLPADIALLTDLTVDEVERYLRYRWD